MGAAERRLGRRTLGLEKLLANRTYYVRTDGSDSNDGKANSAAGAFLTLQGAVDAITTSIIASKYVVTIQLRDGVYQGSTTISNPLGGQGDTGNFRILGNAAAPQNVILESPPTGSTSVLTAYGIESRFRIMDLTIRSAGSTGQGFYARYGGHIQFANIRFGDFNVGAGRHMYADTGGVIEAYGNWSIFGGARPCRRLRPLQADPRLQPRHHA